MRITARPEYSTTNRGLRFCERSGNKPGVQTVLYQTLVHRDKHVLIETTLHAVDCSRLSTSCARSKWPCALNCQRPYMSHIRASARPSTHNSIGNSRDVHVNGNTRSYQVHHTSSSQSQLRLARVYCSHSTRRDDDVDKNRYA
jgi:NAD-dependent oxidoreductase involved in siderophore biosynthesis